MDLVADKINGILESIFIWIWDSIKAPFDQSLYSLKELVFGKAGDGELVWGTFQPTDLTAAFSPLYYSVATLAGFVLVAFIAVHGARMSSVGTNPSKRNEMIQFFYDLIIVMFVLLNLTVFYDLLFQINQGVTGLFSGAYESNIDKLQDEQNDTAEGVIGFLLVQLVLLGLAVWANFYYFMRKVTLIILMAMGPLMLMFYLNPKFKGMTGAWGKELIGSIFIQSIHAFVFWTVATLSATSNGLIETVILYAIFIPISESLRGLLGMGGGMQGGLNKAGAMMGMAGLAGIYGAAKGALNGQSVMSAVKGAYGGVKDKIKGDKADGEAKDAKDSVGASAGDTGTSSRAEKMLRAGDILSKAGKATVGAAGSIAGMGLGPIGSMTGASIGAATGDIVGGIAGRGGTAGLQAISGIGGRLTKGAIAAEMAKNKNSQEGFENDLAHQIADDETTSWAKGNKESVMAGFKERFPDATPKEAEDHFNEVQAQKREGFLKDAKSNIASVKANEGKFASGNSMVNASAESMANQWANDNEKSFNDAYDKQNLSNGQEATPAYLAKRTEAFNGKKAEMKNAFAQVGNDYVAQQAKDGNEPISKADFKNHMNKALSSGAVMVKTSSDAMANQWASDNQKSFNDAYDKENLPNGQEPSADYLAKRSKAFNGKKAEMKNAYAQAGNDFVAQHGGDGNEPISRDAFQTHMSKSFADGKGSANAKIVQAGNQALNGFGDSKITEIGNRAVDHVTGATIIGATGKPNESFVVGQLAANKTNLMGKEYVDKQESQGVNRAVAQQDWNDNKQAQVHSANLQSYGGSLDQASRGIQINTNPDSIKSQLANQVSQSVAFVSGATGLGSLKEVVVSANQGAVAGFKVNSGSGLGTQISSALKGGYQGGVNQIMEQQGGSVEAQAKLQNMAGYTAGAIFGTKGYQMGKNASLALSPFKSQVQDDIQSVSEVIQMARTTTDQHGNTQIAPGAIRQVITKDASYIEVQTKSGTTQTVSRKGAGHSTLKQGEVVYQDLQAVDDSLIVAQSKGGQSSTYRLDSGGGKIPSRVQVTQNPTTLLSDSVQGSVKAAPVQKASLPIYNQKVDSGQFTVEDIKASGMDSPQVVVEKNRQYVTAQKEGVTYRVSPVYSGDTRLGSSETVNIPVQVSGSQIKPSKRVAVGSIGVKTDTGDSYYSSKGIEGLIVGVEEMLPSKHGAHANRSVEKREYLDAVRRKQGLLG